MKRRSFIFLGVSLLVLGIPVTVHALLLMFDTTTTTRFGMLREFGIGLSLAGWGVAMMLPSGWQRLGMTLMCMGTVGVAIGVMVLSQGMPA